MSQRFTNPVPQYFKGDGGLNADGFLVFFESGTVTPKFVYADSDLTINLGSQVRLDGSGKIPNIWLDGVYKVRHHENDGMGGLGTQLWERDPVGGTISGFGAAWDSATQYSRDSVAQGTSGAYFVSLINNNVGNDPESTPAAWSELMWFTRWNTNETYNINDLTLASDGGVYYAVVQNSGNDPSTDSGTNWLPASNKLITATSGQRIEVNKLSNAEFSFYADRGDTVVEELVKLSASADIVAAGSSNTSRNAIRALSDSGDCVIAISGSGRGVLSTSSSGAAMEATSLSGKGLSSISQSNEAVFGQSVTSYGAHFIGGSGAAPIRLGVSASAAAPTHSAAKGSLWVTSGGILYINIDGSTTWQKVGAQ